ncbi:MAG: polymerase sigma-B factor [Solirubrobacteraceae bacterium]|nr:polymerase sigma-B factor [Solirubrobacteraceae bacterium]
MNGRPRPAPGTREDARERRLFHRVRDHADMAARDALVQRYLPLARHLARSLQAQSEPFDDVFQVACIGLIKAIGRFDPHRGVAFSSYATPTITGEIKRHFRDRTWALHMSRDLQDMALRVDATRAALTAQLGREPAVVDLACALQITDEAVRQAELAGQSHRTASLQAPRPGAEDGDGGGDTLGDSFGHADDGYRLAEDRTVLEGLLRQLPGRDRSVVLLRYGLDLTQSQIGERMGMSQMHVSRLLRRSLGQLRDAAAEQEAA